MAHGGEFQDGGEFIKFSDDRRLPLRKLIQPMLECVNLNGKPKIVVTQFCRGTRHVVGQTDDEFVHVDGEHPVERVNEQVILDFL